jgi:hypothetical protein
MPVNLNCLITIVLIFISTMSGHKLNAQLQPLEEKFTLSYGEAVAFGAAHFQWKGYVIEDIVNPDGTSGSPLVTLQFVITVGSDSVLWHFTLPANYQEIISVEPNRVTYLFKGLKFQLHDAVIENHENKQIFIGIDKLE